MSDHGPVEGERTVSAVAGTRRRWLSRSQAIMLIVLGTFAIIVLVFCKNPGVKPKEDEVAAVPHIGRMVPYEPPKPEAIIPAVAKSPPPPVIIQAPPMKQVVEAIVEAPKVQRPAMLSYNVPALSEAQKPKVAAPGDRGEGAETTKVVYIMPGFSLHDELANFVEAGFSTMGSLQTATSNPAKFLGLETAGSIEPGKVADLVLLNANPLDDIHNTQKIEAVVANGRLLDRAALDHLLAQVEAAAKNKVSPRRSHCLG